MLLFQISYCWKSNITRNVCGVSVVKDALSVSTHFLLRYTFSERHFRELFLDFHRGNLEIELMRTSVFFFFLSGIDCFVVPHCSFAPEVPVNSFSRGFLR